MAANKFLSDRKRDPIADLARLITEADPYGESAPADHRLHEEITPNGYDDAPALPPPHQLSADLRVPEQEHELDGHDDRAYYVDDQLYVADKEHQTEVLHVRRRRSALVTAITGLVLVGAAGAFGYRAMFGGPVLPTSQPIITASNEPNKIAPASSEPQTKNSANARQVDAVTTGSIEKLVSREEQPATIEPPKGAMSRVGAPAAPTPATAGQPIPNQVRPHVATADPAGPPPNAVTSQRAGQSAAADGTAEPNSAHFSAVPIASAEATSTPAVTPPLLGSGYAVQVTSERSESGAQAAFRALQAKYPDQLGGRQAMIRRADLGAAGIYYRALVGPFASAEKAAKLCSGLKAAGGDCVILKNSHRRLRTVLDGARPERGERSLRASGDE
jgi:SPOR domain